MILNNRIYDAMKWFTLVFLPALSVFYLALAPSLNLPYPNEVAATIAALDVFLATLLGVSTSNYKLRVATLQFNLTDMFGTPTKGLFFSKFNYDVLTWIAQILLPAFAALYFALANVWNLPYPDQVVATIMAIDTFLGTLLSLSTAQFHKQVALSFIDPPAGVAKILS